MTKLYRKSAYSYSKARYTELCSLPKKRRKPSASPLARGLALGGIWVERSYSPLPVEVVDADLTARTYAILEVLILFRLADTRLYVEK